MLKPLLLSSMIALSAVGCAATPHAPVQDAPPQGLQAEARSEVPGIVSFDQVKRQIDFTDEPISNSDFKTVSWNRLQDLLNTAKEETFSERVQYKGVLQDDSDTGARWHQLVIVEGPRDYDLIGFVKVDRRMSPLFGKEATVFFEIERFAEKKLLGKVKYVTDTNVMRIRF